MTIAEYSVIAAGIATALWVNWYFFISERAPVATTAGSGGVQEITIGVRGGYDPATIHARAGAPIRLIFDRQETSSCSEEVVIPELGVKRFLPAFEKTTIEIPAPAPGVYDISCGMNMLHGKLVVGESSPEAAK